MTSNNQSSDMVEDLYSVIGAVRGHIDTLYDVVSKANTLRSHEEQLGDFWVALMNVAFHPEYENHPLSKIAKDVLEKYNAAGN